VHAEKVSGQRTERKNILISDDRWFWPSKECNVNVTVSESERVLRD
jgi:hypothetical protein